MGGDENMRFAGESMFGMRNAECVFPPGPGVCDLMLGVCERNGCAGAGVCDRRGGPGVGEGDAEIDR